MATLQEIYNLVEERNREKPTKLIERTIAAVAIAAVAVLAEDADTPEHEDRIRWAQSALHDPIGMGRRMFVGVAANPSIVAAGNNAPDGDIQFVVNSLVTTFSRTV